MKYIRLAILVALVAQSSFVLTQTGANRKGEQEPRKDALSAETTITPECTVTNASSGESNTSLTRLTVSCNKYLKLSVALFSVRVGLNSVPLPKYDKNDFSDTSFKLTIPVHPDVKRLVLLSQGQCDESEELDPTKPCEPVAVLVYTGENEFRKEEKPDVGKWVVALLKVRDGFRIQSDLFGIGKGVTLAINGRTLGQEQSGQVVGRVRGKLRTLHIEAYGVPNGCKSYAPDEVSDALDIEVLPKGTDNFDNGITVGGPKIFNTFTLKKMLADTANQLASISPWNAAAITGAYGSIQGISRDTSYLAAQVSTVATPTVTATNATGATSSLSQALNAPITSTTSVTAQCPSGFVPTIGSGNAVTCTPSALASGTGVSLSNTLQTVGGGTTTTTNGNSNSQQVQTTTPSISGVVPTAPASTALAAPTNLSVGSAEMLAEQAQLNSQLTILRLLLQGAASDQLLLSADRAVGLRGQTTLAFPVTLRPPRQYKHAIADVRVLIIPHRSNTAQLPKLSIVNLLPSEKTYNVAKITSKQQAYGAGVAIEAVNIGVATGKSKDRLYIAKDTDTTALQYPTDRLDSMSIAFPERAKIGIDSFFKFEDLGECSPLPNDVLKSNTPDRQEYAFDAAVMFGWQFRPVLGADYVAANMRTVFAQLALPSGLAKDFMPDVWVQTSWRQYAPSHQALGPVYTNSCQWEKVDDAVTIVNPVKVKDVRVLDVGGGMVRVRAQGDFFSSAVNVRSGANNVPPQFFDGSRIEFFSNAKDILLNGDLQLLSEDGTEAPLVIATKDNMQCGLRKASMWALPRPDGSARVRLTVDRAKNFDPSDRLSPEVLIGSDVYGLRDKPFIASTPCSQKTKDDDVVCSYEFEAQTEGLRAAGKFLVRDIAWDTEGTGGRVELDPSFTSLTMLNSKDDSTKTDAQKKDSLWYQLTGKDFRSVRDAVAIIDRDDLLECSDPCVAIFADEDASKPLDLKSTEAFEVVDDSTIWFKAPPLKGIHIVWEHGGDVAPVSWSLAVKSDEKPGITADPPLLYVSDTRAVKFKGRDFSQLAALTYDSASILSAVIEKDKTSITIQIPSTVTKKPGYKEIVATVPDEHRKDVLVRLPINIVLR